jgi:FixJ family two-component response regulator
VTPATTTATPPLVVVIEDDLAARTAIGRLLQARHYEPALFDCAEAFFDRPPARSPSCLVVDVQLPGISGLDLQHQLRAAGSNVPIIVTTGIRDTTVRERACREGCSAFFVKPSDGCALLAAIDSIVAAADGSSERP